MKNLCSQLNSLLPSYDPKLTQKALAVPDQIDEAIKHIQTLDMRLKMAKEKKERLMERKRTCSGSSGAFEAGGRLKPPKMEIHETGSAIEIILTCGVDYHFVLCEIIRILHEENVEVITANSSFVGDSEIHVVHGEVWKSMFQSGASRVSEKLKWFVNGSISDVEMEPELWNSEIAATLLLDPTLDNGLPLN
ncbi:unnamed protein product [Sphenostylis stenocarpa]|uniref:Uncharacterized protein n=1 Tax=Sphenostylis stenocarpa TaxID=92480 RepID=A0AA86SFF1_9FABA|nr:unnamed protein product [Sphenostylis stenocarpa]